MKNGHCLTSKPGSIHVSDHDNMALAEGQINEVMQENRDSSDRSTHIWSIDFC